MSWVKKRKQNVWDAVKAVLNKTFIVLVITYVKHGGGRSDIKTVEDHDLNVDTSHRSCYSLSKREDKANCDDLGYNA